MTIFAAQKFLIQSSLCLTGFLFLFYVVAPAFGYPLEYDQSIRLAQINTPVFLGYLGSATRFLFSGDSDRARIIKAELAPLLGMLVVGPILIFVLSTIACLVAFGWTNRQSAPPGFGLSVDNLSIFLTVILGLLAVTTGVVVSYLFSIADTNPASQK